MSRLICVIAVSVFAGLLPACHAGGDPFYYSTWYAQPSPAMAWSSQSVMFNSPNLLPYSTPSATNFGSPRFFHPGYGYVTPRNLFQSGLPDYGVTYSFGIRQPSMSPVGTSLNGSPYFQSAGPGNFEAGTLHQPWYLPGSPGNHRQFSIGW
jgi:hypothetical protein